jgi:hypothetical protein
MGGDGAGIGISPTNNIVILILFVLQEVLEGRFD